MLSSDFFINIIVYFINQSYWNVPVLFSCTKLLHVTFVVTLRFSDCVFNLTILNSVDPGQLLFNTCGAQYLSERQLRDKTKELENDSFSIFHVNIRSVNKIFEDLTLTLNEIQHKFHIIGLTETWLKSTPLPLIRNNVILNKHGK